MQVYHGSYTEILKIDLSKSHTNKDFGKGFYVTKFRHQAESWAKFIGRKHHTEGFVTEFSFYERAFEDERYKILRFREYNEAWLDFVILNRNRETTAQKHDYDIVEGPIADDKVANRIDDYLAGLVSKPVFLNELTYHEETHQLCFCTINSLQMLQKTDRKFPLYLSKITEPVMETLISEQSLDEPKVADIFFTSETFSRLSDPTTELYLEPWQEIYEMLKQELNTKL
ncbi:MAG: DUF3990 domain-containing protein [Prevotellaceae bacterium]|jgi:hypothetical protein|nr:DUF3990 domain-containing protein [Prevotellaceae bacterium]